MTDSDIITLFTRRDELAISAVDAKYGSYCRKIAVNLLTVHEDAEEIVNDTYLAAWNAIPPEKPNNLKAWLGRIVRNLSVALYHKLNAEKRGSGIANVALELEDTVAAAADEYSQTELSEIISDWLRLQTKDDRTLFLQRYWYGCSVAELAKLRRIPAQKISQKLFRLRQNLRKTLEKEDITI